MFKLQIPINERGDTFEFNLDQEIVTIGRHYDNDIRVKENYVSAYHAEFVVVPDGRVFISDCGSRNGTFLNGDKLRGKEKIALGDTIRFGSLSCHIEEGDPLLSLVQEIDAEFWENEKSLPNRDETVAIASPVKRKGTTVAHNQPDGGAGSSSLVAFNKFDKVASHFRYYSSSNKDRPTPRERPVKREVSRSEKASPKVEALAFTALEQYINETHEMSQLAFEKLMLEDETYELRSQRDKLTKDIESTFSDLNESEGRVSHLKILETEMERSLRRTQTGSLNRKSVHYDSNQERQSGAESEISVCRELIGWLGLLDDLMEHYRQNWRSQKVSNQLTLLRDRFLKLLESYSVEEYSFEQGTCLTSDLRSKILLINADDLDDPKMKKLALKTAIPGQGTVVRTLRPGYIYKSTDRLVTIRKAEVIVA